MFRASLAVALALLASARDARAQILVARARPVPAVGAGAAVSAVSASAPLAPALATPSLVLSASTPSPLPLLAAAPAAAPLRLIIAGAPGSGKGEASKRLARDYGIVHVSSGDLLREHARSHPEVAAAMSRGELVPTELVVGLVRERLARPDAVARGFILDGSPRSPAEAAILRAEIAAGRVAVDALILLDVPDDELLRRVLGRGRSDDTEAVFRRRMEIYRRETVPAVESLRQDLPTLTPDVADSPGAETGYARVKAAVESHLARAERTH